MSLVADSRIDLEALTFDDVLLQPAYSEVLPRQVDLRTPLTARITLNIPLLSAAMDTVTESGLAIALAQEGGIGIIHKNMTPARQAAEVRAVKKYESGIIADPITVPPGMTIADVLALTRANHISGVPVVDGDQLVGIAAGSAEESVAARMALADLPLRIFLDQPLIPYETDEVTRLILDGHQAAAFAPIASLTVGGFRDFLLDETTTSGVLSPHACRLSRRVLLATNPKTASRNKPPARSPPPAATACARR